MVNRNSNGALAVGLGIFPQKTTQKSAFTGTASQYGYDIEFEKGKVVSKKLV